MCRAASSPGTLRITSAPTTSATSYRPASMSAMAPSTAALPEAHAASWRLVGSPLQAGSSMGIIALRCAWPVKCPESKFATWAVCTSPGFTRAFRRQASTTSANKEGKGSLPSFVRVRAKSVWAPPSTKTESRLGMMPRFHPGSI